MDIARREKNHSNPYRSSFEYAFGGREIVVAENSECVDGIGGVIWDGAIVMCRFLEYFLNGTRGTHFHLLELGCGAGLCGLTSAAVLDGNCKSATVSLTDRHVDLCQQNMFNTCFSHDINVSCFELLWGFRNSEGAVSKILSSRGPADVLVGAEIACLRLQQDALLETVQLLAHPTSVVFLTFDDKPPPNDTKYEAEINEKFRRLGFCREVVFTAAVTWRKVAGNEGKDNSAALSACTAARLEDLTACFSRPATLVALQAASIPPVEKSSTGVAVGESRLREYLDREEGKGEKEKDDEKHDSKQTDYILPPAPPLALTGMPPPPPSGPLPLPPVALSRGPSAVTSMHHVTAFFRPEAVRTCQRCHSRFFVQPALHPPDSCKFHKGSYVCRRHPAETKCSIDGHGDNLGYYGTGKEGWAAEFWDCCGSEDPLAPGCCGDLHSPYS